MSIDSFQEIRLPEDVVSNDISSTAVMVFVMSIGHEMISAKMNAQVIQDSFNLRRYRKTTIISKEKSDKYIAGIGPGLKMSTTCPSCDCQIHSISKYSTVQGIRSIEDYECDKCGKEFRVVSTVTRIMHI